MHIYSKIALFLIFSCLFPAASYANPETPHAPTLAWDRQYVTTAEGIDVWLRINVIGASPTQDVDLKFIFQTFGQQASMNDDYVPTNWPSGTKGTISGTKRVAYIKIDILNNTYYEPFETFQVELRSDASGTVISGPARLTITIARSRIMNPVVGIMQGCLEAGEPNNDYSSSASIIALNGGWCRGDFSGESTQAVDYYRLQSSRSGVLTIQLENTTPDQHDLQLYLYYLDGNGNYQAYRQSTNPGQQAESISVPIAANTIYLISALWESSSGSKVPTYRLKADLP